MNQATALPDRDTTIPATDQGLFGKFHVSRIDGRDAPGGDRHGARYFVIDLDHDPHAKPALRAYAEACEDDFPQLAQDIRAQIDRIELGAFVTVPETTLPSGLVVPSFQVSQYLCSQTKDGAPWVDVNYHDARAACERAGTNLLTETQALAIAHNIAQQDVNWTGGKVGEGSIYQGLHNGTVDGAQAPSYEPDESERRWHQLSNGECLYDFAGNAFAWIFDDVQGDEDGLTTKIAADSISLTTAPYPSLQKGMGWRPDGAANWSGHALLWGGYWGSYSGAGVFCLSGVWPGDGSGDVGFRCTKPGL
ncbi:MAG: hypothetical protein AzoDbin1_02120 [Azoarcus sp.]|nr:hypothetical protein [Azoarcus sp.]